MHFLPCKHQCMLCIGFFSGKAVVFSGGGGIKTQGTQLLRNSVFDIFFYTILKINTKQVFIAWRSFFFSIHYIVKKVLVFKRFSQHVISTDILCIRYHDYLLGVLVCFNFLNVFLFFFYFKTRVLINFPFLFRNISK